MVSTLHITPNPTLVTQASAPFVDGLPWTNGLWKKRDETKIENYLGIENEFVIQVKDVKLYTEDVLPEFNLYVNQIYM